MKATCSVCASAPGPGAYPRRRDSFLGCYVATFTAGGLALSWFCSCTQISRLKGVAQQRHLALYVFGVAVGDKAIVSGMRRWRLGRVLYRTPVLFRPTGDLASIGNDAVCVAAVRTVHALKGIEIGKFMSGSGDEFASDDLRYCPKSKADRLVKADRDIHECERNQQAINKWRGDQVPGETRCVQRSGLSAFKADARFLDGHYGPAGSKQSNPCVPARLAQY